MRADNIKWQPVRLQLERLGSQKYALSRHGSFLGTVRWNEGRWEIRRENERGCACVRKSFRAACLFLARDLVRASSDGPQDYGKVHMIRVDCQGVWYTVIFDRNAVYLYQDFTISTEPTGLEHTLLRNVVPSDHEVAGSRLARTESIVRRIVFAAL